MNDLDGLSKALFEEVSTIEYLRKWPTETDTLCKDNSREDLANKYIESKRKVKQYRDQCDELRDKNQELNKLNLSAQREITKLNKRIISHRFKSFVAKAFNKMGFVPK